MRKAVIGIGSNSLRLLVADKQNAILRDREGLRVFASLDKHRNISAAMIRSACDSIHRMQVKAKALGAASIHLFATSAVRDANNQQALSEALYRETGLTLEICSGELEAKLSFLGATEGLYSGMIDIGGGSTEIVIGEGETLCFAASLQAGAVRLFREMPIHNVSDAHRVKQAVIRLLNPYLPNIEQCKTPTVWVGVGGTMTAAATCAADIAWDTNCGVHGYNLERTDVRRLVETLAVLPLEQRQLMGSIPPDRADIFVHGTAILLGCMEALNIPAITVSERTNLDGYLLHITAGE